MLAELRQAFWDRLPPPVQSGMRLGNMALGPVLFAGGFAWDAITLDRIDRWTDNAILGAYLLLLGVAVVLDHRAQAGRLPKWLLKAPWVYRLAVHFFFGGLFSAYVVYYLKSATFGRTFAFLALLAALLVANEFLQRWIRGSWMRLQLYLVCAFSFLLFWIPVATGLMGRVVWIGAAAGAYVATAVVFLAIEFSPRSVPVVLGRLYRQIRTRFFDQESVATSPERPAQGPGPDALPEEAEEGGETEDPRLDRIRRDPVARFWWQLQPAIRYSTAAASWAGMLGVLLILDLGGMIPPVPISVLHTGVYHQVEPKRGEVRLTYERSGPWWWPNVDDSVWYLRSGDRVCVFAPVFSPSGLHPRMYHRWERWDPDQGVWQWTGDTGTWIQAKGGREGGSPHFTCKRNGLRPGPWRVTIETDDQRVVARHRFELRPGDSSEPDLRTIVWN